MQDHCSGSHPLFVADLIPLVLELGYWWPRELSSLATVSSCWLYYVRRELYANPTLSSYTSCSLFAATFRRNESLCALVKGIHLCPIRIPTDRSRALAKGMSDIRYVLGVLDGLTRVTLGGDLASGAHRFLNCLSNPEQVHYLHINGFPNSESMAADSSLEWDETLGHKLSSLRELKLAHLELDIVPSGQLPLLQVADLTLDHVSLTQGSLVDMFSTLSLKTLSVTSDGLDNEVDEQLQLLLESSEVEELRYEVEWDKARELAFMPPHGVVSSLWQLSLVGTHMCPIVLEAIGQCFPSLRDLFISGRGAHITPEEWDTILRSTMLPCLQKLVIPDGTSQPYRKWDSVEESILVRQSACRNLCLSFSSL
ncbi:hypothetical protein BDZ89DRAFT_460682 [Hymenopellis radicata]|nr:hypothetical protein BDZ89DRAFT_460682 [Hymenopellis radicata]